MGWTVRYSCVSERDRWTFRRMSHDPMGPWDGMDSRTHASVEGQVDIPWKVPWGCGIGWTIPCNPMRPWDGMDNLRHFWTALGIYTSKGNELTFESSCRLCSAKLIATKWTFGCGVSVFPEALEVPPFCISTFSSHCKPLCVLPLVIIL